jgi:hypothetical protein
MPDQPSTVDIATRYGLDGPIGGGIFRTGPGAYPASYTMGAGSFSGVKRPGRGVDQPLSSSAEVKEREELFLYSPYGPSWVNFTLTVRCREGCTFLTAVGVPRNHVLF